MSDEKPAARAKRRTKVDSQHIEWMQQMNSKSTAALEQIQKDLNEIGLRRRKYEIRFALERVREDAKRLSDMAEELVEGLR